MTRVLTDVVARCAAGLRDAGIDTADAEAVWIVAHAAGLEASQVRSGMITGATIDDGAAAVVDALTARRRRREPLQHITGMAAFRFLHLHVGPGVFVPRPETEVVAQIAIDTAQRCADAGGEPHVVDLCAGSGAIALSVATEVRAARVIAVEREPQALAWLRRNAESLPPEAFARVEIVEGDVADQRLLGAAEGRVDVVVSNPPYVPSHEAPTQPEAMHDPDAALFGGGADGLDVPRAVMAAAARLLRDGGVFVMEHSSTQGAGAVAALDHMGGFDGARTLPDLNGLDRALVARRLRA